MVRKDIVVIGASAGGVPALKKVVQGFPEDLQASVFVVLHIPPYAESNLPAILSRAGKIPAVHPKDGELIEKGKIYVAPNDHHLIIEEGSILVKKGPKENRFRPSIDTLFRSASYTYRNRVIGIVLSGALDDGTSGLWTIKRLGGTSVVQEPEDAIQSQMPRSAMENVKIDFTLEAGQIGSLISKLSKQVIKKSSALPKITANKLKNEINISENNKHSILPFITLGKITNVTCPECHGSLVSIQEGKITRYRCHTGHAYSVKALLSELTQTIENNLWSSVRAYEELNLILNNLADNSKTSNKNDSDDFKKQAAFYLSRSQLFIDLISKELNSSFINSHD